MEGLLRRLVGADIQLVTRLRPGLGEVKMDPGQLEQVLVNLVLNARDCDAGGRHPHHRDRRAPDQRIDPGPLGQAGPLPRARGQR